MSDANITLIQSLYAAFGRGQFASIVAAVTPDVRWETVGRGTDFPTFGPRTGPQGVQEFFRLVVENEDIHEFSPHEFHVSGNMVFVVGHYAATMRKTGRKVATDWLHAFTIEGGKLTAFREFTDTAQFAEAHRG